MRYTSMLSIARYMPTEHEMKRIMERVEHIKKYKLYSMYKDCLAANTSPDSGLRDFINRCSKLELGVFNAMMYFFFQWQPIFPNDALWDEMNSYLKDNKLISDGNCTTGKFYTELVAIKWIVGFRMTQTTLLEDMEKLDYDENWKEPDTSL